MILPRQLIPKHFDLWRVEAALLTLRKPTLPKFVIRQSAAKRTKIGKLAAWGKKAKRLAEAYASIDTAAGKG